MITTFPCLTRLRAGHLALGLALLAGLPQALAADDGHAATAAPLRQITLTAYRLHAGQVGAAYRRALRGSGGAPPYRFELAAGKLPDGIALDTAGVLSGTPTRSGHHEFTVKLTDSQGQGVLQAYVLSVFAPARKAPVAATPLLTTLSSDQAQVLLTATDATIVHTYRLAADVLKQLKPREAEEAKDTAPDDAVDAAADTEPPLPAKAAATEDDKGPPVPLDAAQVEQLKAILQPLLDVEYPSRALFAAALDAKLCAFVYDLALSAAAANQEEAPRDDAFKATCPPDWAALAQAPPGKAATGVPWQKLAPTLLPPALRDWLISAAHQPHPLVPSLPPNWTAIHCGCVLDQLSGEIYGFYPLWLAPGKPQSIALDLLTRVSYFALPFDDTGRLGTFDTHSTAALAFVRSAQRHGTHLDLTLYRNDWKSLLALPQARQDEAAGQATHQALRLIDTRLDDAGSRLKAWLPGFAETPRVADGITLYFEDMPSGDAALRPALLRFLDKFMTAMIAEMRAGGRPYALNLVLQQDDLMDPHGPWDMTTLFQWLLKAEDPLIKDGRIASSTDQYLSRTNVTLRFVVPLPEPTTSNKKLLRQFIENSPTLQGENRRVFMRKIIAVLTVGSDTTQSSDDMAYIADNFGGAGFWPLTIVGASSTQSQVLMVRNYFLSAAPTLESLCDFICEHRWPLRFAFDLLLLVGALSLLLYATVCRVRRLGRGFLIYLLAGAILTALVGCLLLQCDPNLRALRHGNTPLWIMVATLAIAALYVLLKPRVEQP